jgi:hypothetical protein
MEANIMAHEGGCICNYVRYATVGDPTRVTFCHCRFCQRATGSAYLVEPIFDRSALEITAGTPTQYGHVSEGSGQQVTVNFCATCGTKLFLTFERWPDIVGVYGGTFDDPNWFPHTGEGAKHIFLDMARHGTVVPAGIDTFGQHATETDGTPISPAVLDAPRTIGR